MTDIAIRYATIKSKNNFVLTESTKLARTHRLYVGKGITACGVAFDPLDPRWKMDRHGKGTAINCLVCLKRMEKIESISAGEEQLPLEAK